MGLVYRLGFPNGKSYIGVTTKSIEDRYAEHAGVARRSRRNSILYNAWRKHGAPKATVLLVVADEDLYREEVRLIAEHGTFYPGGYNSTIGGEASPMASALVAAKVSSAKTGKKRGRIHTEESRRKIAESCRGRTHSPEARAKMSAARKGKPSPLIGRKLSAEHSAKMSAAKKGCVVSESTRAKIAAALTGRKGIGRAGMPHTAETRAKISATKRAKVQAKFADAPLLRMLQLD